MKNYAQQNTPGNLGIFPDPVVDPGCCAKCRRGSKQLGVFPCAFDMRCVCHTKKSYPPIVTAAPKKDIVIASRKRLSS